MLVLERLTISSEFVLESNTAANLVNKSLPIGVEVCGSDDAETQKTRGGTWH